MSDETSEQKSAETSLQEQGVDDNADWLLRAIIESYAQGGVQIGVTLTVGGSVVSGTLISGRTYFEELQKMLASKSTEAGDLFSTLAEDFGSLGPEIYDKPEDASDDWKPGGISYVHLKNARFHAPGQKGMPAKDGFLWRGKLVSVDAFSIGAFVAAETDDED